ncbi:hypothetical protein A0H81_05271 [Grifola frondosa]|uniref:Uncharacterized protein n=1 Tax=Grifola frondosa TaxID=5627 RepID=A0A1C7MDM9_GRIFR|nr:hypothetical protein A0H81_05271 [Grifola frondosa]
MDEFSQLINEFSELVDGVSKLVPLPRVVTRIDDNDGILVNEDSISRAGIYCIIGDRFDESFPSLSNLSLIMQQFVCGISYRVLLYLPYH